MEEVIIALGSNLGDRLQHLSKAGFFLHEISEKKIQKAAVWESEPVGGAKYSFLNTAAKIFTNKPPRKLLVKLKEFEQTCGREKNPKRWAPRIIDLDIISYGNLVIEQESLIIPHPEFSNRLFVLNPMKEICPDWQDPQTGKKIDQAIKSAPKIDIRKTDYSW